MADFWSNFLFLLYGYALAAAVACLITMLYCRENSIKILFPRKKRNHRYLGRDLAKEADRYIRSLPIHEH